MSNIKGFELLGHVCNGLQPYDSETGQPIPSPEIQSKKNRLKDSHERLMSLKKKALQNEEDPPKRTAKEIEARKKQYHFNLSKTQPTIRHLTLADVEPVPYYDCVEMVQWDIEDLEKEITKAGTTWKNYRLPASKEAQISLILEILNYLYMIADVEKSIILPDSGDLTKPNQKLPSPTIKIFPCDAGTKWEDVKISKIDDETVRIKTPLGEKRFTYHQIGLADGRSVNKPGQLWTLLQLFAQFQGCITRENRSKYIRSLPDTAKRLNQHMQEMFGIKESIYIDHYKKEKGYRTKIFFSDASTIADL